MLPDFAVYFTCTSRCEDLLSSSIDLDLIVKEMRLMYFFWLFLLWFSSLLVFLVIPWFSLHLIPTHIIFSLFIPFSSLIWFLNWNHFLTRSQRDWYRSNPWTHEGSTHGYGSDQRTVWICSKGSCGGSTCYPEIASGNKQPLKHIFLLMMEQYFFLHSIYLHSRRRLQLIHRHLLVLFPWLTHVTHLCFLLSKHFRHQNYLPCTDIAIVIILTVE